MRKELIFATTAMLTASVAGAQSLDFTGAEHVFGPALPGSPYLTIPDGTPVDGGNTYIPVAVPGTYGGYLKVGDVLGSLAKSSRRQASEIGALASSVTIVPPNAGDRFAFTLSGATVSGRTAGSASASYRISNQTMAFAAAARSEDHTLAKAGLSLSVR